MQIEQKQENDDEEEVFEFRVPIKQNRQMMDFVERYFAKYYRVYTFQDKKNENQYAFLHSNKLFVVGIANEHQLIKENQKIVSLQFECYEGNINDIVKGKKKRGGIRVQQNTVIATVTTEDQSQYKLRAVVDGMIIEFNDKLLTNPNLLIQNPESTGYLAILNCGPVGYKKQQEALMTSESYMSHINQQF